MRIVSVTAPPPAAGAAPRNRSRAAARALAIGAVWVSGTPGLAQPSPPAPAAPEIEVLAPTSAAEPPPSPTTTAPPSAGLPVSTVSDWHKPRDLRALKAQRAAQRAAAHENRGEWRDAAFARAHAAGLLPEDLTLTVAAIEAFATAGLWDEVAARLAGLAARTGDPQYFAALGGLYRERGDYPAAATAYAAATREGPCPPDRDTPATAPFLSRPHRCGHFAPLVSEYLESEAQLAHPATRWQTQVPGAGTLAGLAPGTGVVLIAADAPIYRVLGVTQTVLAMTGYILIARSVDPRSGVVPEYRGRFYGALGCFGTGLAGGIGVDIAAFWHDRSDSAQRRALEARSYALRGMLEGNAGHP